MQQAVRPEDERPSSVGSGGRRELQASFSTASSDGAPQQVAGADGTARLRRVSRGSIPWAMPRVPPNDEGGGGARQTAGWYSMPGERRTVGMQARHDQAKPSLDCLSPCDSVPGLALVATTS